MTDTPNNPNPAPADGAAPAPAANAANGTNAANAANAGGPAPAASSGKRARRRWLRPVLLLAGPLVVIAGGVVWYYSGGRYISTENAYVHADMVAVAAQIDGPISQILIRENQHVKKGDVLFRIDPEPFAIAVDRARASLAAMHQELSALKESYQEQRDNLKLAQIDLDFAQKTYDRQAALRKNNVASQAALDAAQNGLMTARQRIVLDQQEMKTTLAKLDGDAQTPVEELPQYRQAASSLAQAELDLAHTDIVAPFDGIISKKPYEGAYVKAGQAMASLVSGDVVWIDANFKEVDLTWLKPGQEAEILVDAYPGQIWHGRVDSVAPATGAEFSVIPAQNATGNWVKVVQRIPVRIAVMRDGTSPELRAGMSTVVEVDTHHRREMPAVLAAALDWIGVGQAEAATADNARTASAVTPPAGTRP